jgi:hypothetical protein
VSWIKPEDGGEFCVVNREFPRVLAGHIVSLPNAGANISESEALWHTLMFSHFSFQPPAFSL